MKEEMLEDLSHSVTTDHNCDGREPSGFSGRPATVLTVAEILTFGQMDRNSASRQGRTHPMTNPLIGKKPSARGGSGFAPPSKPAHGECSDQRARGL